MTTEVTLGEVARRIDRIDARLDKADEAFNEYKNETDRRFRNTVNLFIGGGITLVGGAFLLLLQIVAR